MPRTTTAPSGSGVPAAPAQLAHEIHSCLDAAELRERLDRCFAAAGRAYTILFQDRRTGAFAPYLAGPGDAAAVPADAHVRLNELLEAGDGRIAPVADGPPGPGGRPARAAATLSFRDEKYGLLLLHGGPDEDGGADGAAWQPAADALATELVKLQLYEAASRESATAGTKLSALNEAGDLVRYVDLDVLMTKLMQLSVGITHAQVGAIVLVRDERIQTGVEWGLSEEFLISLHTASGEPFLRSVLDEGEPVLIPDAASSPRIDTAGIPQQLRGLLVVPLRTHTERIGAIVIANPDEAGLTEEGFDVLSTVANLCASAVQNALLYERALGAERIEAEMRLAASVQAALLPDRAPAREEIELTGWNVPCEETGGDYYDFIDLGSGRTAVVIGDATGHGMGAALMMFIVRSTLRALLTQQTDLVSILETMNDLVEEVSDDDRFMTLFIGVVDARGQTLSYATAGHDPPLVLRKGELVESSGTGGVPLGVLPGSRYRVVERELRPGDVWVFGTDGIWEARNPAGEFYGKDRLVRFVCERADRPLEEVSHLIREDILAFHDGAARRDDITGVFMRVVPRCSPE